MKRNLQVIKDINSKESDENFEMFKVNPHRDEMVSSYIEIYNQLEKEAKTYAAWEKINA